MDDLRKKVINGLELWMSDDTEFPCESHKNCPYRTGVYCLPNIFKDMYSLLKEEKEAKEEVSGTLDKLIKETQELLSKTPTDFDIVKGIIERSSLRKHFDEATIETGEHIITLRHGADEVDLLFDKEGRIE